MLDGGGSHTDEPQNSRQSQNRAKIAIVVVVALLVVAAIVAAVIAFSGGSGSKKGTDTEQTTENSGFEYNAYLGNEYGDYTNVRNSPKGDVVDQLYGYGGTHEFYFYIDRSSGQWHHIRDGKVYDTRNKNIRQLNGYDWWVHTSVFHFTETSRLNVEGDDSYIEEPIPEVAVEAVEVVEDPSYGSSYSSSDINDMSWLYGKWTLRTEGIDFRVNITSSNLKYSATDYDGTIDIWDGSYTLYMDHINVNGTETFKIDLGEHKLYTPNWKEFKKQGSSGYSSGSSTSRSSYSGSSYSSGRGSSDYSSTTFRTSSDVMSYVANRFRNSVGNVITVKWDGMYSNGNQITNAVRVVSYSGSRATLSATSPYTQGTLYFTVDASRGTITDGSGDVFYKR